ncbi:MAG TPA: hypothetical protein VHN14_08280 [Kofleriaceae bacterium]|nr:hypothetical protein [Kofleriaceae bacterium]
MVAPSLIHCSRLASAGFASEVDECITGQMSTWRSPIPKNKDGEATDASFEIALQLVPD